MDLPATTLKLPTSLWLWFSALFPPLSATAKGIAARSPARQMSTPPFVNQVRNGDSDAKVGCDTGGSGEGMNEKSIVETRLPPGLIHVRSQLAGISRLNRCAM